MIYYRANTIVSSTCDIDVCGSRIKFCIVLLPTWRNYTWYNKWMFVRRVKLAWSWHAVIVANKTLLWVVYLWPAKSIDQYNTIEEFNMA